MVHKVTTGSRHVASAALCIGHAGQGATPGGVPLFIRSVAAPCFVVPICLGGASTPGTTCRRLLRLRTTVRTLKWRSLCNGRDLDAQTFAMPTTAPNKVDLPLITIVDLTPSLVQLSRADLFLAIYPPSHLQDPRAPEKHT